MRLACLIVADPPAIGYGLRGWARAAALILIGIVHAVLFTAYRTITAADPHSDPVSVSLVMTHVFAPSRIHNVPFDTGGARSHNDRGSRLPIKRGKPRPADMAAVKPQHMGDVATQDGGGSRLSETPAPKLDVENLMKEVTRNASAVRMPKHYAFPATTNSLQNRLEKAISQAGRPRGTMETIDLGGTKITRIGDSCYTDDLPYRDERAALRSGSGLKKIACPASALDR